MNSNAVTQEYLNGLFCEPPSYHRWDSYIPTLRIESKRISTLEIKEHIEKYLLYH